MKKMFALLLVATVVIFGLGRFNLGESGAMRFLKTMEKHVNQGNADKICAMYHDDIEVQIADNSGDSTEHVNGGKTELCAVTREAVDGLSIVPFSMSVSYTQVKSQQDWRHPWTGTLSYVENRTLTIGSANVLVRTVSNEQITLVQTLTGVKLRKLKSEVYKSDAT